MPRQVMSSRLTCRSCCSVSRSQGGGVHQWLCGEEWEAVYNWLFSSDLSLVEQGVGRVAAWRARGEVPMMVELTADLCGCRLQERERAGSIADYQSLLHYSMIITRFVNGIGDIAKLRLNMSTDLMTCLHEYGLPSWLVTLRHMGTHQKLPSIGALRSAAEFCLRWLRANYWRPQRLSLNPSLHKSLSKSTILNSEDMVNSEVGVAISKSAKTCWKEKQMMLLTSGLCRTRKQLEQILGRASYKELADHLMKKKLLQFPSRVNYSLTVPGECELDSLPVLCMSKRERWVWRKYLLRAARISRSLKQRLISSLIMATHQAHCKPVLRDFLCGWLYFLLRSQQGVKTENTTGVDIIQILEEEELFLPGELSWQQLLQVLTQHPGYYSYPLVKLIAENVKLVYSEAALQDILHMSRLVTFSSRIGHTSCLANHTHHKGDYSLQVDELLTSINQARMAEHALSGGCGQVNQVGAGWIMVENVDAWLQCPLGLCPDQKIGVDMFSTTLQDRQQVEVGSDSVTEKENVEEFEVVFHASELSEADCSVSSLHVSDQQLQHIQQQLLQLL